MNAKDNQPDLQTLRDAIGRVIHFRGQPCRIIEILDDGPTVVIECLDADKAIQANQFGDASRRVAQLLSVPVFGKQKDLNPDYVDLKQALEERSV